MPQEQPNLETILVRRSNGDISEMLPTGEKDAKGREIFQGLEMEVFLSPDPNDPSKTVESKGIPQKAIGEKGLSAEIQSQLRVEFEAKKAERITREQEELGEEALELTGVEEPAAEAPSPWSRETAEIPVQGSPTRENPTMLDIFEDNVETKTLNVNGREVHAVTTGYFFENGKQFDIFVPSNPADGSEQIIVERVSQPNPRAEEIKALTEARAAEDLARARAEATPVPESEPLDNAISGAEADALRARLAAARINQMPAEPAQSGMIEFPAAWKQSAESPATAPAQAQEAPQPVAEVESTPDYQAKLDALTEGLSQKDKNELWSYASSLLNKAEAQQEGDGEASTRYGQYAGQSERAMSPAARDIKGQYLSLFSRMN